MKEYIIIAVVMIYIAFLIGLAVACLVYGKSALSKRIYDSSKEDTIDVDAFLKLNNEYKIALIIYILCDILNCIFILTGLMLAIGGYLVLVLPVFSGGLIAFVATVINHEVYGYYKAKMRISYNK